MLYEEALLQLVARRHVYNIKRNANHLKVVHCGLYLICSCRMRTHHVSMIIEEQHYEIQLQFVNLNLILIKGNLHGSYHVPLVHKNITNMNAHETISIENFQTLYVTRALQLEHNIVIAMSSNHPAIGEKQ